LLYATAIVIGTGEIAHSAAAQVLLPHLAKGDALASANGQIGAAQAGGLAIVGPAVGGVVFSASRLLPFAADSLSFAASGALLVPLRAIVVEPTAPPEDPDTAIAPDVGRTTARRQITSHPLLRVLLVQMMTLAFAQSMVMSTLPIFGRRYLGLSGGAYGLTLGLSAIGNVVGSVVAPRLWQGRRTTVVLLIGSGLLAGAAYVVMAAVKSVPLAIAMLAIEALAVGIINTVSPTLRMEHAPVASRARVATTFTQILFITQPVGAVIAGLLARSYGVTAAYSLAGSLILAVVLLTDRALRRAVAAVGA
jgi:predicted MFS family arabinose efflux permease